MHQKENETQTNICTQCTHMSLSVKADKQNVVYMHNEQLLLQVE